MKEFLIQFANNEKMFEAVQKYFDENLDTRVTEKDIDKPMSEFPEIVRAKVVAHKLVNDLFKSLTQYKSRTPKPARANEGR